MANVLEFLVKLNDMASGALKKFGETGTGTFNKLTAGIYKMSSNFNRLGMNITQIDAKLEQLRKTRAISFDSSQIRRINGEIDKLQSKKDRLEGGRSGGFGNMFRTGLAIAGIGSLAYLGKDVMQAGIDRSLNLISLQTLEGKAAGQKLNDALLNYAKHSTYGGEVMSEGKLMAGAGLSPELIAHLIPKIGDIALGKADRMQSLALALSEVNTRGHMNGQVERMFIQGGLFNPLEQLNKMTGESKESLEHRMLKGKISVMEVVKAIDYATSAAGRWGGAMANIMGRDAGKWIAFKTNLEIVAGDIGLKLLPALGHLTGALNWIVDHGASVAIGIGAMTAAWIAYTTVTKGAAIWSAVLEAFTSPWLAIAGIGIATAAVADTFMSNADGMANSAIGAADKIDKANKKITGSTDEMAAKLKSLNNEKGGFWSSIGDWLGEALKDIWWFVQKLIINIAEIGQEIGQGFKGLLEMVTPGSFKHGLADVKQALFGGREKTTLQTYMDNLDAKHDLHKKLRLAGKNDDGSPLGSNPMSGVVNAMKGAPDGGSLAGDTSSAITGGGVRNITINVAKFQDKTEIHTTNLRESVSEVEDIIMNMFLRITNSAAAAIS
jgi:hypothetical protein